MKESLKSETDSLKQSLEKSREIFEIEKRKWEKESFRREDILHEVEKKLREKEREFESLLMENEQQVLEGPVLKLLCWKLTAIRRPFLMHYNYLIIIY